MTTCNDAFILERITAKKALLAIYDTALSDAVATGVEEYTLDDGQGRQTVKRLSQSQMRSAITRIESEIVTYTNRLTGCGVTHNRGQ